MSKTVFLGSDHAGLELKTVVAAHLAAAGHSVVDLGPSEAKSVDYPDFAKAVCAKVLETQGSCGILICGTGIGMSIAANKVPGAYAALVSDTYSAARASKSNDANIITLGAFVVGPALAKELVEVWLKSEYTPGGPSDPKVKRIYAIEEARLKEKGNS